MVYLLAYLLIDMEQKYKQLTKILSLKPEQIVNYKYQLQGQSQYPLQRYLLSLISKEAIPNQAEIVTKFISYMLQQRHCRLSPENVNNFGSIKIMACSQNKVYNFDQQSRAYCLYGKALSIFRRKIKETESQRHQLCSSIQSTIFQLFNEGNFTLSKNESHQIDDVLLNYLLPDDMTDPILLSNEVFSPFVPQPFAIVMVISIPLPRPQQLINFFKGTLLHILVEQSNLWSKVIFREMFYKNTLLKGIYFIQQGQVESNGGRIVARGWMTNGKCKSQGYGWKFKPLPFFKSIAKNQHIWKQFLNDLTLNKQYPFRISYILGIQNNQEAYQMPDKKVGKRGIRLPRIGHSSFDYGKLTEMEKVKHYDDRINEICDFKEKLYLKKAAQSYNKSLAQKIGDEQKLKNKFLQKNQSLSKQVRRYPTLHLSSSSENILIMSVLRKLEDMTQPKSNQDEVKQKKDKIKISPAKLYQKSRIMKKKRYNQ